MTSNVDVVAVVISCRWRCAAGPDSLSILSVADLFHPVDVLAVEGLLNGGVGQSCRRRCSMPVLFARREPDDVSLPDLLDGTTLALNPAATGGDDQSLADRVHMPGGAGARLE